MGLALIVIPDPSTPSREHGLDAPQVCHLPRLENAAPWVDQRNAIPAEHEPSPKISGIEYAASESRKPVYMIESRLSQLGVLVGRVHRASTRAPTRDSEGIAQRKTYQKAGGAYSQKSVH
jgi:hypothetical protein